MTIEIKLGSVPYLENTHIFKLTIEDISAFFAKEIYTSSYYNINPIIIQI
jgi:hypothetical protein